MPEPRRAGRLDGRAQPPDDGVGGRQRDPGGLVRSQRRESKAVPGEPASDEELAVQLRPSLRAAVDEADERVADLDVGAVEPRPRISARAAAFVCGSSALRWSSATCSRSRRSSRSSIQSRGGWSSSR